MRVVKTKSITVPLEAMNNMREGDTLVLHKFQGDGTIGLSIIKNWNGWTHEFTYMDEWEPEWIRVDKL